MEQWQGGDIVIFEKHIGIVSDRRNWDGVPYVIHHNDPWQTAYEQDIAAGLYFTIKTGFIQFRLFGESIRVIAEKREDRESISSFQALMVSTASRVGISVRVCCTFARLPV